MRSPPNARGSPRCRRSSRPLSAKPSLPIAGLRSLPLTKPVGPNASKAPAIRLPRSISALLRQNAPQIFAEKRGALITEVRTAETARQECADRLQRAENALAEADRDARAALEAASAAREDLARAEERFEGARRRLSDIGREIRDMLEIEPAAVAELAEIGPTDPLPDLTEIEEKLERLRRERERLGAVNLRAEEELREVETQHSSLTTE